MGGRDEIEIVKVCGNNLREFLREKRDNKTGRAATGILFKLTASTSNRYCHRAVRKLFNLFATWCIDEPLGLLFHERMRKIFSEKLPESVVGERKRGTRLESGVLMG